MGFAKISQSLYNLIIILKLKEDMGGCMYHTKQKGQIIHYLESLEGELFTIESVAESPKLMDTVGKSTVYRVISQMVKSGDVKKYYNKEKKVTEYMYMGPIREHRHIHLKCTHCDKLIHVTEKNSDEFLKTVQKRTDFQINLEETVLFGACGDCLEKGN